MGFFVWLYQLLFKKRQSSDMFQLMDMSLIDLCSHVLVIGGTGSGKTSLLRRLLIDALSRGGERIGGIFCCVKPDEARNFAWIAAYAGAEKRSIILRPGKFRYNFLAYEMQVGDHTTATKLLLDLNKLVKQTGDEKSESFWENLFERMCSSAILLCYLAKGISLTIEDVLKLVTSSPSTFEMAGSDSFQSSYCYQILKQAENNVETEAEKRLYTDAAGFFMSEILSVGDKARGAAMAQVVAVISPLLRSPLYETVVCEESDITPEMATIGGCMCLDAPIMSCGVGGVMFQSLITTQVTEAALRRENPNYITLIVRDELQKLTGDASTEAMNLSVARSQKLAFISGVQSLPTLQSALGGIHAEQELHSLLANYSTKCILSNPCSKTNSYFSESWGQSLEEFVSVSESKQEEELDLLNMLMGNDRLLFNVSNQYTPRCRIERFLTLRRGGKQNNLLVDFFLTQAGKTYGADHSPFKLVTFKQE